MSSVTQKNGTPKVRSTLFCILLKNGKLKHITILFSVHAFKSYDVNVAGTEYFSYSYFSVLLFDSKLENEVFKNMFSLPV